MNSITKYMKEVVIRKVNTTYGAPIGRNNIGNVPEKGQKVYDRRVKTPNGYDAGGAYWGIDQQEQLRVSFTTDGKFVRFYRLPGFSPGKAGRKALTRVDMIIECITLDGNAPIGPQLRKIREGLGVPQGEMFARLQKSKGAISVFETNTQIKHLSPMAEQYIRALGVQKVIITYGTDNDI